MDFKIEQVPRLEQRLLLTQRMQQALRLLQLPLARLETTIQNELDRNPTLELSGPEEGAPPETRPEEERYEEREPLADRDFDFAEEFSRLLDRERDIEEHYRVSGRQNRDQEQDEETRDFWENSLTRAETLDEHLLRQLRTSELTPEQVRIGEEIIGEIDEKGYLQTPLGDIARRIGAEEPALEHVLAVIQHFDPSGVGARDLRECLLIQLNHRRPSNPLARPIIAEHLEALGRRDYGEIARILGADLEAVRRAAEFISSLEPNPGRDFAATNIEYVTPEIHVAREEDGRYRVSFDHDTLPELRISRRYREMLESGSLDEETRKYIRERIQAGQWLIDNIRQRRETLRLLAEEIVRRQKEFLDEGPRSLKPLKMGEIASAIGRHESTVSRAVANKYMLTPRGVFPLRFFFSGSLSGPGGEDVSSLSVRENIKDLVAGEDPRKPLSDQEIVRRLREQGITLARRTVAKYREMLSIPSTRLRRRRA